MLNIIEGAPVALIVTDLAGKLLALNREGLRAVGVVDLKEALQRPFEDFVSPEHRQKWSEFADLQKPTADTTLHFQLLRADQSISDVEARGVVLTGTGGSASVFLQAVWAREIAEGGQQQRSHELRALVEQLESERARWLEERARLEAEGQRMSGMIDALRADLRSAKAGASQMEGALRSERDEARAALESREQERRALAASAESLQVEMRNVRAAAQEMAERLACERDEARHEGRQLVAERRVVDETINSLREEIALRGEAEVVLTSQLEAQCALTRQAEAALETARAEYDTRMNALERLTDMIHELKRLSQMLARQEHRMKLDDAGKSPGGHGSGSDDGSSGQVSTEPVSSRHTDAGDSDSGTGWEF